MAVHKLQIDDFVTIDYELIAIHSSLEDYRLAYFINQQLHILLEKCPKDIGITTREGESCFSRFFFEDTESETAYNLIRNKNSVISLQNNSASLFADAGYDMATSVFLLPEYRKADYILKVENMLPNVIVESIVAKLLKIQQVNTAYTIEHNKLKSKNNLIF